MKHLKQWTALLLSAAFLLACAQSALAAWTEEAVSKGDNLIVNPGFEQGLEGWNADVSTGFRVSAEAARSGGYGFHYTPVGTKTIRQKISVSKAGEYEFQCFIQGSGIMMIYITTGSGTQTFGGIYTFKHWQRFTQSLSILQGEIQIQITLMCSTDAYLDDFALVRQDGLPPPLTLDPAQNAVANSGFENGLDGWAATDSSTVLSSVGAAHSGAKAMQAASTDATNASASAALPAVLPPGEYEFTAYVYLPSAKQNSKVNLGLSGNGSLSIPVRKSQQWVKLSYTLYVDFSSINSRSLAIWSTDAFYVDDVHLTPTSATLEDTPSLLQNGGFENGLTGWASLGEPCAFATDAQALDGAHSAYFGYFASGPLQNYIEQACPVKDPGAYTLRVYLKPEASLTGAGAILVLEARDAGGQVLASATSPAVSDASKGWQKTAVTLNVPAGAAALAVKIGGVYCTGAFYADTVTLQKQ